MSGLVAAFSLVLAFPALASAHTLTVSASPSACVTSNGANTGQYTSTVTITEQYFGGTTEVIPVGLNVTETSSDGAHGRYTPHNYFTQGAVGTQTGPASLGQPTSFTSPNSSATATKQFVVTTSVPETYVLGNSWMSSPSTATITAPKSGCTPPSCPSGQTLVNGVCVPPTSCPAGETLSGGVCVPPTSCPAGETLTGGVCVPPTSCPTGYTRSGSTCVPPTGCPSGEVLSGSTCVPPSSCPAADTISNGQCVPPSTCPAGDTMSGGQCVPPTTCPSGETLSGGQCVPPTTCPAGDTMSGGVCTPPVVVPAAAVYPAVCRASTQGYKVRAGQRDTIIVSVTRNGAAVTGTQVRVSVPGGKTLTRTTAGNGKTKFVVKPTRSGTIIVRSPSCKEMVKVKVFAAKAATAVRAPSFTG
ncbi:MAG TPA: EB domain-containing protein [Solirubrobacteraceae bacterium]|nr:EB domain-containing protein [Solirubrobacteraceae bacterium]